MSEYEDRQDATSAIDAPASAAALPVAPSAPAAAEAAPDAAGLPEQDDLEAIAVVEGVSEPDVEAFDMTLAADEDAARRGLAPVYPEVSDAAGPVADTGDEPPLLDDTLEDGIASVFAALHAAARNGEIGESDEPNGPLSDDEAADGITFRLLGELDRLWHRAA
jgi:hypothetical protein